VYLSISGVSITASPRSVKKNPAKKQRTAKQGAQLHSGSLASCSTVTNVYLSVFDAADDCIVAVEELRAPETSR